MNTRSEHYRDERTRLLDALNDATVCGDRDVEIDLIEQITDLDDQYYQENDNVQD